MVPELIEREIVIDAPPDLVWAVITEAEHVGGWFSDRAEIDLRPGGEMSLTWEKHGTSPARVETVEPPRLFAFRWSRGGAEPRGGDSTLVEFSLAREGEGTRLRMVESGFPELDWPESEKAQYADENSRGWDLELDDLVEYIAERRQSARR